MKQLQHMIELHYMLQKTRAYLGKLAFIKHNYITTVSYVTEQYQFLLSHAKVFHQRMTSTLPEVITYLQLFHPYAFTVCFLKAISRSVIPEIST